MLKSPIDYKNLELTGLDNDFFTDNRKRFVSNLKDRLKTLKPDSVLVLKGGEEVSRYDTDITYYNFSQEANFYYLTGVTEPSVNAIIDLTSGDFQLLFNDPDPNDQVWMKPVTKDGLKKKYNVQVFEKSNINILLDQIVQRSKDKSADIYTLEGTNQWSKNPVISIELDFEDQFEYLAKHLNFDTHVYEALCFTRAIKSDAEIELIRYATNITVLAHKVLLKKISEATYERDVEAIFNEYLSDNYGTRFWSYPNIGGSGANSAILHYEENSKLIDKANDIFLADMGVRFCNYATDVTSTFPVSGTFSDLQKAIYQVVLATNKAGIAAVKPQITYSAVQNEAYKVLTAGLLSLNLIKKVNNETEQQLVDKQIYKLFMPHGLGHFVGLDVHDVGYNTSFVDLMILRPGHIVTIEPGIYFIQQVINDKTNADKLPYLNMDEYNKYNQIGGFRIEDMILVTDSGSENLSKELPREVSEIENYMKV